MNKVTFTTDSNKQTNTFDLLLSESEMRMLSVNPKKVVLDALQREQTEPQFSLQSYLNSTRPESNFYQGEDLDVPTYLRRGFSVSI
jgi:hypothetical protein